MGKATADGSALRRRGPPAALTSRHPARPRDGHARCEFVGWPRRCPLSVFTGAQQTGAL